MKNFKLNLYNQLKEEVKNGNCKLIVLKELDIFRFSLDEINALITLFNNDPDFLKGTVVFVKEINIGIAALIVSCCVKIVYAEIISHHAASLLNYYGVSLKKIPKSASYRS